MNVQCNTDERETVDLRPIFEAKVYFRAENEAAADAVVDALIAAIPATRDFEGLICDEVTL